MFRPQTLKTFQRHASTARRALSTLSSNPHIYVFPHPQTPQSASLLSLLPTSPPTVSLAVGSTTTLPPTPESLTENPHFLHLLQAVLAEHATHDPEIQAQAQAFASRGGASLASGGARTSRRAGDGAGGASGQGGPGGAGVGGWVHAYDTRNPPDWGRIPWPEDIFGSLNVDGEGRFVGVGGSYQSSGTYRVCTNEGILGLTPFLREKLVERLREIEKSL